MHHVPVNNLQCVVESDTLHFVTVAIVVDACSAFAEQIEPKILHAIVGMHAAVIAFLAFVGGIFPVQALVSVGLRVASVHAGVGVAQVP